MVKLIISIVLIMLMTVPASADWKMTDFMIYLFNESGCPDPEKRIETLAKAGFNVIDGNRDKLDLCKKYGLKLLVKNVSPEDIPMVSQHPALYGYYIIDEPLHNFPALAKLHEAYRSEDPDHIDYTNLISLGGEYLADYMKTVKPRLLSYDYYQYWWGVDGHFTKLGMYRKATLEAGIPFVLYFEANSSAQALWYNWAMGLPTVYRPDNLLRIRESIFTALAYGIKGVEWFWDGLIFKPGTCEFNECGKDVAVINSELKVIGPVLVKLHSIDVFHTEPLPNSTKAIPPEHWIQLTNWGYPGLVLGTFRDDADVNYAMVSNTNWEDKQIVAMEIRRKFPMKKVEKLDKKTGEWIPLEITDILSEKNRDKITLAYNMYMYSQRTGGDNILYREINEKWLEKSKGKQLIEFELAPGDGELFRFTPNDSFDSLRQTE